MGHVFLSPLNWGLGHSTRDIPIIKELLSHGHEVTIGTSGNALALLKKECPECNFILFKDYPAPYSASTILPSQVCGKHSHLASGDGSGEEKAGSNS